jgi:hypothetical protein
VNISADIAAPPVAEKLLLDRGIAADLGHAEQAEKRQHELIQRADLAVREDGCPCRVDAGGKVVGDQAKDVSAEPGAGVAVGDDLVVGDQHEHVRAEILEPGPAARAPRRRRPRS